jgi:hypothetical protein
MDHSAIGLIILGSPFVLPLIGLTCRRLYWTEWVQERVLRTTGTSRLVATAWGHTISPRRPPAPRRAGDAPAGGAPGNRRTPVGVPAVHLDAAGLRCHPQVEADTATLPTSPGQGGHQLAAPASEPPSLAGAVHHPAGA